MVIKFILIGLLIFPLLVLSHQPAYVKAENLPALTSVQHQEIIVSKKFDDRAEILNAYLAKYNSPLQYHAQDFVDAADTYALDWRLVAAISGVESTFGKKIPGGTEPRFTSYNAWGWGVYGTQAIYFDSFKDGIYTVSEGLKKRYVDRGYKTPQEMNRIYAASPVWGSKVNYFLADIDKFESQYPQKLGVVDVTTPDTKVSAQLIESNN